MRQGKVLLLTPFYPPNIGGAETFCQDLYKFLRWNYMYADYCTIDWKKQKVFEGTGLSQFMDVFPKLYSKARKALKRHRYNKVYAVGLNAGLVCYFLSRFYKFKYSVTLLALYGFKDKSRLFRFLAGLALRNAEKVFVEGYNGADDVKCIRKDIEIFYHWCDQKTFRPYNRNDKKIKVLFVGRPIAGKGIYTVKYIENQMSGVRDVEFVYAQKVPYDELPDYYKNADILIVPSEYEEGFTRVVIEGASCGLAVLVSNRGSLPEQVKGFGYVCKDGNEFEKTIRDFIKQRHLLELAKDAAYRHARENFSSDNAEVFIK